MKIRNTNRDALESKRVTFFLIGLTSSLALALVLFDIKTYIEPLITCTFYTDESWTEETIVPRNFMHEPEAAKEKTKKTNALASVLPDFIALSNETELGDFPSYDEGLEDIERFGEEYIEVIDVLALSRKPVFPGCEQILNEEERFTCFKESMAEYVGKRLKPCTGVFGVTPEIMYAQFIVNENGRVTKIEIIRGQDSCNIDNVENVLRNLPVMQPGEHMGKKVCSRFTLPVNIR